MNYLKNYNLLKSSVMTILLVISICASANDNSMEASLSLTIQQAKLFPDNVPLDGEGLGISTSIDGNRALVGTLSGKVYVYEYDGSNWLETSILEPSGERTTDRFGYSVSLKGDIALIGAPSDDENGVLSGAVYIFKFDAGEWTQFQRLTPADSAVKRQFGWRVSLADNIALIGTNYDFNDPDPGSAYMFRFNVFGGYWYQAQKIIAVDGTMRNNFGISVSLSASKAVIGSSKALNNGIDTGAVYMYDYTSSAFDFHSKLVADDGESFDTFGESVSLEENRLIVGSPRDDYNELSNSGSAYLFDYDGLNWSQSVKLRASNQSDTDYFGAAVGLKGDTILIGSFNAPSSNNVNPGAVYLYQRINGNWPQIKKFNATDDTANDNFGGSVALGNNTFFVGNKSDDDNGSNAGTAYVFNKINNIWQQQEKLLSSFGPHLDKYGYAVSIDGTRAIIGAYNNDDQLSDSGSAYIFDYTNGAWSLTQQLYANDAGKNDWFGIDVSLSGDRVVISATGDDSEGTNSGAVYVFDLIGGSWVQTNKIVLNSLDSFDRFGSSLSLDNNRLLIGATGVDLSGSGVGAAYLYDYVNSSWSLTKELSASDADNFDSFGESVSLDGDRALIGAHRNDDSGSASGSAYIFDYQNGTWSQSAKLTASDAASLDYFGRSVSLSGDSVLIGAYGDNSSAGAAYVFDYDGINDSWNQSIKLLASDAQADDSFGTSVALENNILLIGANQNNDNGSYSGSTYVFQKINNVWQQTDNLKADDGMQDNQFGRAVSLSSELALIGSPFADAHGESSGAVYVYDVDILPVAIDDDVTTDEDQYIIYNVLLNDTDSDGGNNVVLSASDPVNGNVLIDSPNITYLPLSNYCNDGVTTDDFTYTLNGGAIATVHVSVTCIEEIATAVDDAFSIDEDVLTILTVLDNDYDVDSDNNTIMIDTVNQPTNGTVVNNSTSISYTPNAEYCNDGISTDDFTYTLVGGWQATVEVTVNCVDDPAVAIADTESINEDTNILIDVINNDTDIDGGMSFVVTGMTQPQFGTVTNESGQLRYTPNQDYCNDGLNIDGFEYTITGNSTTTVEVTVNCVNDQPDFSDLGDISTDMIKTYSIENWAYDFDFGSTSENSSQLVNDFNLMVVSDTNSVISFIDVANDGQLSFTTTGNIGSAIIEVSMQDDGGTDLNGVDTSMTKSLTILFDDTIYSNGFESSNESSMFDYLDQLALISDDLVIPYYDQGINSIVFYQYEFTLDDDFFSQKTVKALQLWISEILRYSLPTGDFDLDGTLNYLDESISL